MGDMKKKLMIIMVLFAMILNIRLGYLQATNYIVEDKEDIEWYNYDEGNSYIA